MSLASIFSTANWWDQCKRPEEMLDKLLLQKRSMRKLRLFVVAVCRLAANDCDVGVTRNMVFEVAEKLAEEGWADNKIPHHTAHYRGIDLLSTDAAVGAKKVLRRDLLSPWADMQVPDLLRCVFGNPFRSWRWEDDKGTEVTWKESREGVETGKVYRVPPQWLSREVRGMCECVCQDRDFGLFPMLADALQEAGCCDVVILEHLKRTQHCLGCWVLDLLTGKE